jgi:NAD(P)-dependent dehydrogenase (short-subunit alcohol dehydrogenase family)
MSYDAALSGQVVMITGAGRGIQFAIAHRLGHMGTRISSAHAIRRSPCDKYSS